MNGYEKLVEEIMKQAAKDYVNGFKSLYRKYGNKFLADGFAVEVPAKPTAYLPAYAVAKTGKRLSSVQCMYFDTVDFIRSDRFAKLTALDPENIICRLRRQAMEELKKENPDMNFPLMPSEGAA